MRPQIRRAVHALAAAVLIGCLCGFGSFLGRIGGYSAVALNYITSTYVSTLAQNGWVTPGTATYTPFVVNGTATGAGSKVVTGINTAGMAVGDEVYDGDYYTFFPFGTTIQSIDVPGTNGQITLSHASFSTTPANQSVGLWISPAYPVSQWTWDAAKTTNQPPNALAGGGGTALATFATGIPDGTAAITGVNNVFGASAGWWVTSGALSGPIQVASISGSAPNYAITLVTGGNALIRDTTTLAPITIQPNEPTIIQYRNSAAKADGTAGTAEASDFSGYIAGTTLTVPSAPTSGTIAAGVPLYDPGSPASLAQGTYITAQLTGTAGGAGTYSVSDSQTLGSSGSPVALQTMGTVATFHTAYGAGGSGGAFSYAYGSGPTYEKGDVFTVLPAIYAGTWEWFSLVSAPDGPNCGIATTAGSAYVSYDCAGSATNGLGVGDTVRDGPEQAPMQGYINGTTFTVLGTPAPFGTSIPEVGEPLTGGGVAAGTIITACGAAGCANPGNFTIGCETGYSGACNTQVLGSPSAPIATTAQSNWPLASDANITAVYSGGNASCPLGTGHVCFQVSPAATFTKVSADNWGVQTNRPMDGVTVEGITGPINGSGSYRPAIAEDSDGDANATWQLSQGMVWIGAYSYNGYVNNLLFRNIDLESNGLIGTEYLLWFSTGITGTTTIAQSRLEGQIWSDNTDSYGNGSSGDAVHSADVNIFMVSDLFASPSTLSPEEQQSGTLNFEGDIFDLNGGSQGPQHNVYMGAAPNWTCNFINVWSHDAQAGHLIKSRCGTTNVTGSYLQGGDPLSGLTPPQFTGSIAATGPTGLPTLTVSSISSGTLYPGQVIMAAPGSPTAIAAETAIMQFIPGTGTPGGKASYTVACINGGTSPPSCSQTVASEAMEGDYFDCNACGPVNAESVNAEFPCGGAVTVQNTIMTKGMGGGIASSEGNPNTLSYGAEMQNYTLPMTVASPGTPLGSATVTFTANIPDLASIYNDGSSTNSGDETNPNAYPWGTLISNIGTNSVTVDVSEGEVFTASFSGTSMNVTGFTGGTGSIAVGAPLWDANGHIPGGTVVTACPGGNCSATGTYTISQSAGTIASETVQTGCGTNVCQAIQPGDVILLWRECPWGAKALNKLYVQNDDFVNFHSTYELNYGHQPIDIFGADRISQLPGDAQWPFNAASDWSITDNIFAGFPAGANNPNSGQDNNSDTAAGNLNLYFADWPWTGTIASGQGSNAHVQLVISPAELTQSFLQNFSPQYADASDTGIEGVLAYVHAAIAGVARTLPIIGAEEIAAGGGSASCGSLYGDLTNVCNDGVAVATEIGP